VSAKNHFIFNLFQWPLALAQYEALNRRHESIIWLTLLAVAAVLRFAPVGAGLPYISYIDEGHVLHPAIEILRGGAFDSSRFTYPPLTSYLTIAAAGAYAPIYRLLHHHRLRQDLSRTEDLHNELGDNYDLITPPEIILLGRLAVACLSIGTVILAGAIARRLGGARAALLALLFTSICPALISRGSIAIIDTTAAFFAVTTVYFCQQLRMARSENERAMWRNAGLAGFAAGLAFGAKYTVGLVFVAVIITIATLPVTMKTKGLVALIASAGLIGGIFCGVPAAVLHPDKIIAELRAQAGFYQTIRSEQTYWGAALSSAEVGIPLLIAGLAGMGWMLSKLATRNAVLSWLAFAVLLVGAVAWPSFQPFRNLLSVVPLLCVAAALLFDQVWLWVERRRLRYGNFIVVVTIAVFTFPLAWSSATYLRVRLSRTDSRIQAIDWLEQHAGKGATVLGIRELAILPAEWRRIPADKLVVPWFQAADVLQQQTFDYVVTGDFDLRYATDPARWSAYRKQWINQVSGMPAQAQFGNVSTPVMPYLWRTNDERVVILKGNPR
jgi:4-amino-4-deoxy-L-arabinose transferase-like glycosyltransferase